MVRLSSYCEYCNFFVVVIVFPVLIGVVALKVYLKMVIETTLIITGIFVYCPLFQNCQNRYCIPEFFACETVSISVPTWIYTWNITQRIAAALDNRGQVDVIYANFTKAFDSND